MKKLLSILFASLMATSIFAQASAVSGAVNASINFTLLNTNNPLGNSSFPLSLPAFIQGALTTGTGIGKANQLYASQFTLTNGVAGGSVNFHTLGTTDPVGNAYSLTQVKMLIIENLGVVGSPFETNVMQITGPNSANCWTNFLGSTNTGGGGSQGLFLGGPSGTPGAANTPTMMFWNPGDVGWTVGAGANNTLILTNPQPGGSIITGNLYVIGSTGL